MEQDPEASKIPYTRDVTHILRALLQLQEEGFSASTNNSSNANDDGNNNTATSRRNQRGVVVKQKNATIMKTNSILEQQQQQQQHQDYDEEEDPHMVRLKAIAGGIQGGMKRTSIPIRALHDGWNSMNIVFGDACPGTSKKLHVHYVIFHTTQNGDNASTEVHHVSFSEYDPVVLRRRLTFYQDETTLQQATARVLAKKPKLAKSLLVGGDVESSNNNNENDSMVEKECNHQQERGDAVDDDEQFLLVAKRMGRSQSISDFAEAEDSCIRNSRNDSAHHHLPDNNLRYSGASQSPTTAATITTKRPPRLRSASFEIVLPMMLSFLEVRERVQCRLVCRLWRNIVRDWGVASIIDSTDPTFKHAFNRPFLRGILAHSYSSLHSLRLSDFDELTPEDLHPSLPHLRKLRVLDISRCIHLNDDTLSLLAEHANSTLEVLYIKGLTKVSDAGVGSICKSCRKLTVLDVSNTSISDETGVLIGELTKLRALYMRDNFRLTNKSIDAITANCTKLNQLVLWGCVKLKHLTFEDTTAAAGVPNHKITSFTSGRLVSLSLWGCYSLRDDVAISLGVMTQLRSLIVSECHRLTDNFAVSKELSEATKYNRFLFVLPTTDIFYSISFTTILSRLG